MEETPEGTPVGVDDPYTVAGACDHLTGDGRCRYALNHAGGDAEFAAERRADGYACVVADTEAAATDGADPDWSRCPHYRSTTDAKACARCGLEEVRIAHDPDVRPLIEEHHLSYGDAEGDASETAHEITVALCRWCHTKVHRSFARIDDDVEPDPEAFAAREERRAKEQAELDFATARERRDSEGER